MTTANEEFTEAYHEGGATANTIAGVSAIASLLASAFTPAVAIPTAIYLAGEGASQLARHQGVNEAIKEKMDEKGYEFNESVTDPNAIARSVAGALMSTGLPLAHAIYESKKSHDVLKALGELKGLTGSQQATKSLVHAFSKPKNLAIGLITAIIGGALSPHAARIAGGNPFEDIENEEIFIGEDNESV